MAVDLFAGVPVRDYQRALDWYGRLLGSEPSFFPTEVEAVWQVSDHGWLYIVVRPERAGQAEHTLFVEDLDERMRGIAARGVDPTGRETYPNGVRKVTYRDPDGNEVALGGGPSASS